MRQEDVNAFAIEYKVPGWAVIYWSDHEIKKEYYGGFRLLSDSIAVDENTFFEAASLSKTVFSALVLAYFRQENIPWIVC
jgi:CubicO group peptidase (beta-lactamase class C family)